MEFENMTWVPYEREAILPEMLTKAELAWLNAYHQKVYEIVGPMPVSYTHLSGEYFLSWSP